MPNNTGDSSAQAQQKVAVVTGCSSGIGESIARLLLLQGWRVLGLSRREVDFDHPDFAHIAVDLNDAAALQLALQGIERVDALVHAAGLLRVGRHTEIDLADGEIMWRTHVQAAALLLKYLSPQLPRSGRVVLIGSRVATGAVDKSLYAASKAAYVGFARSVAMELADRAITVNIVSPAATDTPMLRDPARARAAPALPPFGRLVQPDEIAAMVGFLLSPPAASITGQQIVICGGASL